MAIAHSFSNTQEPALFAKVLIGSLPALKKLKAYPSLNI